MTYASGTAAASLGLTQSSGAYLSTPGQIITSPSAWMNNVIGNENSDWASFQMTYLTAPDMAERPGGMVGCIRRSVPISEGDTTATSPIVPSSSAAQISDPAGTYSGAGRERADDCDPGRALTAARARARATTDPAGTYSLAGASAPIADPGGTYSAAGASAPATDPAGRTAVRTHWIA